MRSITKMVRQYLAEQEEARAKSGKRGMDKKGVFGLENVTPFMKQLLVIGVFAFAIIFLISIFTGSSILPAGSQAANDSNTIFANITAGLKQFAAQFPTFFNMLVVVVVVLLISVVIFVLNKFGGGGGKGQVG